MKGFFNILDYADVLEPTGRRGRYFCPVCNGNDFTISPEGAYQCWHGCEITDIRKAVADLSNKGGDPTRYQGISKFTNHKKRVNVAKRTDLTAAKFPFRGIEPTALLHFDIRFDGNYNTYFEYYKDNRFLDYKVRPFRSKDIFWQGVDTDAGRSTNARLAGFFGEQLCTRKSLLITEGEFDAVAAHVLLDGRVSCVSVPHGAKSAPNYIKSRLEWVEKYDKVFICFDMDSDGLNAADEVMDIIKPGKAYRMVLNRKDANQYLQEAYNPQDKSFYPTRLAKVKKEFQESWWAAQPKYPEFVFHEWGEEGMADSIYGKNPSNYGVTSGFPELDKITGGLRKGEVTTIFADPAAGKSSMARHIAAHRMKEGDKVLIVSLEEPIRTALMEIYCHYFKKDVYPKSPGVPAMEPEEIGEAKRLFETQMVPTKLSCAQTAETIQNVLEYGVRIHDVNLIIFDNITAGVAGDENVHKSIDKMYTVIQDITKTYGVHAIVVSHTKRRENPKRPPTLMDGYGSGGIERFSNTVITIHESVVRVIKNRRTGETGEFTLYWNKVRRCYEQQKPQANTQGANCHTNTNHSGKEGIKRTLTYHAEEKDNPNSGGVLRQPVGSRSSPVIPGEVSEDTAPEPTSSSGSGMESNNEPGLPDRGEDKDDLRGSEGREDRQDLAEVHQGTSEAKPYFHWEPKVLGEFPQPYIAQPKIYDVWAVSHKIRCGVGVLTQKERRRIRDAYLESYSRRVDIRS